MAFDAVNIFSLAVLITWTCLNSTAHFHPIFGKILPSQDVVEQLFGALSISFAPGLFEVLQTSTPPTVAWFKKLPAECKKHWAIYLLILWKSGCRPRIYIGSGTESTVGVALRFWQYDNRKFLPSYVEKALDDGYVILHKGLLCWMPIPPPAEVPVLRVLFVALEGAFTFVFWAINHKANYTAGLASLCPWDPSLLEYDGLCSHNPLVDHVSGDFDLTPEEREEHAVELKGRKYISNVEGRERRKAADPEAYRLEANWHRANFVKNNPEAAKNAAERCKVKALEEKRFYCDVCDHAFPNTWTLNAHLATKRHANKVADSKGIPRTISSAMKIQNRIKAEKRHYCAICKFAAPTPFALKKHIDGKAHAQKVALVGTAVQKDTIQQEASAGNTIRKYFSTSS